MSGIARALEMARYAVREASRNRLTWVGLGAGVLFLGLYAWGLSAALGHLAPVGGDLGGVGGEAGSGGTGGAEAASPPELSRAMLVAGIAPLAFWPASLLAVALGGVLGAGATAGELDGQTALATLARPLGRGEWLFGKALGAGLVLTGTVVGVSLAFMAITWRLAGAAPTAWAAGSALVLLEGWVAFALALALGTRLGPLVTLVAVVLVYGLSLIGQVVGFFGRLAGPGDRTLEDVSTVVMLLFPANGLFARAAYLLSGANPFVTLAAGPLGGGAPPTAALTYWALGYTAALMAWAWRLLHGRELG
ncbi:MAG: hypothetical protein IRZ11_04830 [Clostridia bacterium]|nr:hypothetical protein [Clostridia bacterium]